MRKVKILICMIILSVCVQSVAAGAVVFADTHNVENDVTTETEAMVVEEPQTAEPTAVTEETPAATKGADTEIMEIETVELNLLQNGSLDPADYDVQVIDTVEKEVPASETEIQATPSSAMEDYIAKGMDRYETRIDISGYGYSSSEASKKKVFKAITNAINNNPRLFFIGNNLKIGTGGGKVLSVWPEYTMSSSKADSMKKSFDSEVNKALATVDSSMSASQKAKAIHNYLIKNAEYDMVNYKKGTVPIDSYRANGVLVKGIGVCQSYAMAYKYIMEEKLGIRCVYASTKTHIWNMVKIDGKYYNVDTTWDDGGKAKVLYTYFLESKSKMSSTHKGKSISFEATPAATAYGAPGKIALKSTKAGKKQATVKWGKNSATAGYQVYYSTKKSAGFKNAKSIGKNSTVSYTKKSLKKGKTYYFKVRGYKTVNGKKVYGSFSSVKSAKVK